MSDTTCTGDPNKCCGACGDNGVGMIYSPDDTIECRVCGHRTPTKQKMLDHVTEYHPTQIPAAVPYNSATIDTSFLDTMIYMDMVGDVTEAITGTPQNSLLDDVASGLGSALSGTAECIGGVCEGIGDVLGSLFD